MLVGHPSNGAGRTPTPTLLSMESTSFLTHPHPSLLMGSTQTPNFRVHHPKAHSRTLWATRWAPFPPCYRICSAIPKAGGWSPTPSHLFPPHPIHHHPTPAQHTVPPHRAPHYLPAAAAPRPGELCSASSTSPPTCSRGPGRPKPHTSRHIEQLA